MLRKLVRRVILWAVPSLPKESPKGGEIKISHGRVEADPQSIEAFKHIMNELNRIERRR